jgi:hypothetical protein
LGPWLSLRDPDRRTGFRTWDLYRVNTGPAPELIGDF